MLGGDIFYNIGASLFTPLPFIPKVVPIFGHFFLNSGNLISTQGESIKDSFRGVVERTRTSIGVGIALKFSVIRAEFNWVYPLTTTTSDIQRTGYHFGIGMDFL